MVRKLEFEEEEFYRDGARALLCNISEEISNVMCLDGATLKKCGVNQRPKSIGYYIEYQGNIIAYFIVEKWCWYNFSGFEANRGWVCPELRGRGLYSILRKAAVGNLRLISDSDGMTESAYNSWIKDTNFDHSFFELQESTYVDPAKINENEKFTEGALGGNWRLVLTPKTQSGNS